MALTLSPEGLSEMPGRVKKEMPRPGLSVPLLIESPGPITTTQPITVGLPFPRGALTEPSSVTLTDPQGRLCVVQTGTLARWPDGSVKWLLLDFLLGAVEAGQHTWTLGQNRPAPVVTPTSMRVRELRDCIEVDTGPTLAVIGRRGRFALSRVELGGRAILDGESSGMILTDPRGHHGQPRVERAEVEACGPVRTTVRLAGRFEGRVRCRFRARLSLYAGTGLIRLEWTLHNPNRARHPGGIWDLGDPGSLFFRDLTWELRLAGEEHSRIRWRSEPEGQPRSLESGGLEIYQDSSGGENWQSPNHVNRSGRVPVAFRGYRVRHGGQEEFGLRASPVVALDGPSATLTAAIPEFWQQFPKAIEADGRTLRLRLFPGQFDDLFELQGGEQKTHTLWLNFGPAASLPLASLEWVHQPARIHATPEWYAGSGAIPHLTPATAEPGDRLESLLSDAAGGPNSLFERRETIDEYGWRNFGDVYADHEAEHYHGPAPVISHYNNQYDLINGTLLQYLRSGDGRWFEVSDALARHVIDIDIYHTTKDKAAFNGGLFWHTDHYRHAGTCTHRSYSRKNVGRLGRAYGGGPGACHNYATGLLHYHYLTGNPLARDAVVSLADWVIAMDDGAQSILGILDPSPTGLANDPGEVNYQGPCRGAGNSVNTLMDAWLLTGQRRYLLKAEELIRRVSHPDDDVATRDLLEVERRWSYTVFLSALARYLEIKAEAGDLDLMYAYARSTLVRYARWMLDHEKPYFDQIEKLEYPTETWAGQEFRKANVLGLAAAHEMEPLRSAMIRRGNELAERALSDLYRFRTRGSTRALTLVLSEGTRSATLLRQPASPAPGPARAFDFGKPAVFITQKKRVLAQMRSPHGLFRGLVSLMNVRNWGKWRVRGYL